LMELLAPVGAVYQAGTLSGNPVAVAAGLAVLQKLRNPAVYDTLEGLGAVLDERLAEHAKTIPFLKWRRVGSLVWFHLDEGDVPTRADEISPAAVERFRKIYRGMLLRGHYLPPSAYELLFLSTAHVPEEVLSLADDLAALLRQSEGL